MSSDDTFIIRTHARSEFYERVASEAAAGVAAWLRTRHPELEAVKEDSLVIEEGMRDLKNKLARMRGKQ